MAITLNTQDVLSKDMLARICTMREENFGSAFGLERVEVAAQRHPDNFYYYQDNGSDILAVAHLDTVVYPDERQASYANTADGLVIHSGALDDRLGAYTILDVLPKLGVSVDILFTVGEEMGQSTAAYFAPTKQYDWMIEFDRGGTDVVTYQYQDKDLVDRVRDCGARHSQGIFSDISYLDHLGCKGLNWGVGYQDYHSKRGYAYLDDYCDMIDYWQVFHAANEGIYLPHLDSGKGMGHKRNNRQTLGQAFMALDDERGRWDDLYPESRYTPVDDGPSVDDWDPSWHGTEKNNHGWAQGYHSFNEGDWTPDSDEEVGAAVALDERDPFYWSVQRGG